MDILFIGHSHLRWLVLLVAAIAVVKFAIGWLRGGEFKGMDRGLTSAFSGVMDLQATLGFILFIWMGVTGLGFPMYRIEHAVTMLIAASVAHLPARWKHAADGIRFRNGLFCILGALLLVYLGVMRLPGGWSR
ncbi:MAG: hypothetical protein QY332_01970 [Anaerolineales bacterium]|nr:MAG: hypothetical protein QY332_01970 [Anaerolineales bacterium]